MLLFFWSESCCHTSLSRMEPSIAAIFVSVLLDIKTVIIADPCTLYSVQCTWISSTSLLDVIIILPTPTCSQRSRHITMCSSFSPCSLRPLFICYRPRRWNIFEKIILGTNIFKKVESFHEINIWNYAAQCYSVRKDCAWTVNHFTMQTYNCFH